LRIEFYFNAKQRKRLTGEANLRGETVIHDDFLENGKKRLTFDIIPDKIPSPREILLELLLGKLQNNTITFEQLKTLIRLEHNFELTQTTRDKILIAVQGVIGSLRDRIINAFNL